MTTLAKELRKYRKKQKLTQVQLAQMLGTSQQMITSYERGKTIPTPSARIALIELGFPKDVLIPQDKEEYYMATMEQREAAEELRAICKLVASETYCLPTLRRIKTLKTAIADYESTLCKRDRTDRTEAEA